MKITKFWARGYRSLRDVTLDPLGDFNVFYGPNGSGKSNVLAGIRTLFDLIGVLGSVGSNISLTITRESGHWDKLVRTAADRALGAGLLRARDVHISQKVPRQFVLGVTCKAIEGSGVDTDLSVGRLIGKELTAEITADFTVPPAPELSFSKLSLDGQDMLEMARASRSPTGEDYRALLAFLLRLPSKAFALVDADRTPRREEVLAPAVPPGDAVASHLRDGRLKNALFAAQSSPDLVVRRRFRELRGLLEGEPLHRPPFDLVQDPTTHEIDIREPLAGGDVSLDLAGLGVAQIYALLAGIVLSGARAVGIEEPEAHLHAPTRGRELRVLLQRLVAEGQISQLFIATHSNLFDLDPTGYWDVALTAGETHIERAPLDQIDARHLYEPGPAKHALHQLLRYAPESEEVFRRPDGTPVTAGEMLQLLQKDDETAVEFLRNLHGAAMRVLRLGARPKGDAT